MKNHHAHRGCLRYRRRCGGRARRTGSCGPSRDSPRTPARSRTGAGVRQTDMLSRGWGRIVNVSSGASADPAAMTGASAYTTAKAALEAHLITPERSAARLLTRLAGDGTGEIWAAPAEMKSACHAGGAALRGN